MHKWLYRPIRNLLELIYQTEILYRKNKANGGQTNNENETIPENLINKLIF